MKMNEEFNALRRTFELLAFVHQAIKDSDGLIRKDLK